MFSADFKEDVLSEMTNRFESRLTLLEGRSGVVEGNFTTVGAGSSGAGGLLGIGEENFLDRSGNATRIVHQPNQSRISAVDFQIKNLRLDLPQYDGAHNPDVWIFKIKQRFRFHQIPQDYWYDLASMQLTGEAIQHGLSASPTVPAFLWSPHYIGSSQDLVKELIDYRTVSPREFANSILTEGGWSEQLCPAKNLPENVDIVLVFVGRKLKSSDILRSSATDLALVDFLKHSFTTSNYSMAFPYVAMSDEATLENTIISEIIENCEPAFRVNHVALSGACSFGGEGFIKLSDLHSVLNYLHTKTEARTMGQADLIVFCSEESEQTDGVTSEAKELSGLISFLEKVGARYTVLYTSNPLSLEHHRTLDRYLIEGSLNSTACDEVCQIKSSLLEGIFVAIVLLIILLSGLCCMMGIDTPTRFETPQES